MPWLSVTVVAENAYRTVNVRGKTYEGLEALKPHPRVPFDDVLRALIAFWRKEHGDEPVVLEEA